MKKDLRIFICSPGDLNREREAMRRFIDQLAMEFAEHIMRRPYCWEWEPLDFGQDYQSQLPIRLRLRKSEDELIRQRPA